MTTATLTTMTSADPRLRFHHGERVEVLERFEKVVQGVTLVSHRVRLASGQEITVYADQLRKWRTK
ncbi:hypothetical protein QC999_gp39 [Microbacterium phage Cressida]|uniref:Uncharacterized protein n=1 Tax=Microbacterium phage Cressida TaxID=2591216 RepID=A0A514DI71_9CAUD|nr:hypothetical protein QC999_gp39 [Microbacterium phage Cressida]QDH93311.1 hypothetical protein PBI_CRESSIDA_69 [Microbacterium phage Cressida]